MAESKPHPLSVKKERIRDMLQRMRDGKCPLCESALKIDKDEGFCVPHQAVFDVSRDRLSSLMIVYYHAACPFRGNPHPVLKAPGCTCRQVLEEFIRLTG